MDETTIGEYHILREGKIIASGKITSEKDSFHIIYPPKEKDKAIFIGDIPIAMGIYLGLIPKEYSVKYIKTNPSDANDQRYEIKTITRRFMIPLSFTKTVLSENPKKEALKTLEEFLSEQIPRDAKLVFEMNH